tara:strand:+ start:32384 stop:32989 length:606 start_codon:yes stop_codon:yes gene_type:complete
MKKKFLVLAEGMIQRFTRGSFLVGDVVKFNDDFKSTDAYKGLHPSIQAHLDTLSDSDINIKVKDIKNLMPSGQPGSDLNNTGDVVLDLVLDYGGGRYVDIVSTPASLVSAVNHYPNLDPIPDALKRDNMITIKPELVAGQENYEDEAIKQTETTNQGGKDYEKSDHALQNQNVQIPSSPAEGDRTPEPSETYTNMYLPQNA